MKERKSDHANSTGNGFQFKDYKSTEPLTTEELATEYEKFMSKPIKTDPAEILVYENIFNRQQTKEYKEQAKFQYVRNNAAVYILTHSHRLGKYYTNITKKATTPKSNST